MGAPVRQGSHIVPRETGYVIRLGSAGEMADQRDHKQNQKDVENDFRDPRIIIDLQRKGSRSFPFPACFLFKRVDGLRPYRADFTRRYIPL